MIKKDMKIGIVLDEYPETIQVFSRFGFHCIGCDLMYDETIEEGAIAHGVDVNALLQALNMEVMGGSV